MARQASEISRPTPLSRKNRVYSRRTPDRLRRRNVVPVPEVGDRGGHHGGDRLQGERLVGGVQEQVEQPDVHDEGEPADHAELHQLAHQVAQAVVRGEQRPHRRVGSAVVTPRSLTGAHGVTGSWHHDRRTT